MGPQALHYVREAWFWCLVGVYSSVISFRQPSRWDFATRSLREVLDAAVVDGAGRATADLERRPVPGACAIAREMSSSLSGMRDNGKG